MMAQQRRPCTCGGSPPPSVDLTRAYDSLSLHRRDCDQEMHATIRHQLVKNLQSTGWSLVELNVDDLPNSSDPASDTTRRLRSTLQAHELWKDQLMELFEPDVVAAASKRISSPNIVYRAAESGAPGTVEPKQSWEALRCTCSKSSEGVPPQEEAGSIVAKRMKGWVSVLHSVAVTVQRIVQFPEGILLHEESCHSNDEAISMPCSADLLRAFFYDTVTPSSDVSSQCLGSSPHTDWGSFTVVWQDTVGGLQTFCHGCEQWANVPAESHGDSGVVRFVVHVGDVTSLALGHALQTSSNKRREEAATDDNFETSSVVWPSPKHRVLSPTIQKRASLVYFAYPPHDISIREITTNLSSWCQQQPEDSQSLGTNRVPYDDYYLLHNQSKASSVTPEQQFGAIVDRPLKDILADKWEQVQRG